uniref:Uncharacterized protein n=1 Tax=Knipowitschia caucasica TaxID=637954 RepID=A0AAV2J1C4_KNICA
MVSYMSPLSLHPCTPPPSPSPAPGSTSPSPTRVRLSTVAQHKPAAESVKQIQSATTESPAQSRTTHQKNLLDKGILFVLTFLAEPFLICISTSTPSSFAYSKNGERASHRQIQFHVSTRHAQE